MERKISLSTTCSFIDVESGYLGGLNRGDSYASQDCLVQTGKESPHGDEKLPSESSTLREERKGHLNVRSIFSKRKHHSNSRKSTELQTTSDSRFRNMCQKIQTSQLGSIFWLIGRLQTQVKPDFDEYQEKFPPKSFPTPEQTWYNIPSKDDGSHSWPLTEIWPPAFIIDLRKHIPIFMAMFVAVVLPICLIQRYAYPATQKVGNRPGYDCMHTGDFNLRGTDVNLGQMPFAQAKAIDLAWNAVVGRGMQAFLIFISCKLFYAVLMYTSERHPVTYELFAAVSLTPTGTNGIRPLAKAIIFNSNTKVRLMLVWLLGSTVYIALTPILVDALSGYRAIQATVLQLADGSKLDVSSGFTSNAYQNLERNQPPDYLDFNSFTGKASNRTPNFELVSNTTMIYFSGQYRLNYHGQNISEVFSSSCINTTTSVLFFSTDHYTYFRGGSPLMIYEDPSCRFWFPLAPVINEGAYGVWNQTFLRHQGNYECVSKDIYTWGFSYELLLIYSCISGAWTLGTWAIYVYASVHSELLQKGRMFGTWRAVMDISESLKEMIGENNLCAYTERELSRSLQGRNMAMYKSYEGVKGNIRFGLREIRPGTRDRGRLKLEWAREYG
ncbi:hypothetical protein ONS95_000316 [Cadophora gregata]|uniref:uncharacterized protein n=1 Tax=Cadophora gregata TaxID=51156 RepID=UPI0026DD5BD5|nr:uncharacterized protein ONS95_000316 [Cadophora gregata]KAK0128341.1 hypothetical protein ONS95_000316 [Cadophora gregata]